MPSYLMLLYGSAIHRYVLPRIPWLVGLRRSLVSSGGELGREDVDLLTNGPKWSVVFSTGSGVNAFDYESVSEHWLSNPNGGAVAYMGKTRSLTGNVVGEVDTLTFHNVFDSRMPLGQALAKATESTTGPTRRVVASYALLGDPELQVWTAEPDRLDVTVSPSTFTVGEQSITVTVKDLGTQSAVQDARVALKQADRVYGFDLTDSQGKHVFDVGVPAGDTMYAVATATNYTPLKVAIPKGDASVKQVVYSTHTAADDSSLANSNGVVDAGEFIKLTVEVQNVGSAAAGGVAGKLYATAPLRFGSTVDGTYQPGKVWLGTGDQHPPDLVTDSTFTYPDFHGVDFRGRSAKYDTSTAGGLFIWREKNLWNVVARGNPSSSFVPGYVRYRGSVVTKGGLSDTTKAIDALDGDVVHFATADSIYFNVLANNGSPADEDKFSFVAREVNWLTVVDSTNSFGHLEPNATAQNRFTVRMLNAIEDRHEPVFELAAMDSLDNDVGTSQFALPVVAPVLSYLRQAMSLDPGFCGHTYCRKIAATVRNGGSGVADSVRATLSLTAGSGSISDNLIIHGPVLGSSENAGGADTFSFGTADTTKVRFQVDLVNYFPDGTTRTWTKTGIDVVTPGTPSNVMVEPHQGRSLTVRWSAPASASGLAGYNVYRRLSGEGSFPATPTVTAPFDSTRWFQDVLLQSDTTYVYAVAAQDSSGNESAKSDAFSNDTWVAEHGGWPKLLDAGTPASPIAVNIDDDNSLEIIALGNNVYAWNQDGTPVIEDNEDGLFFAPGGSIQKPATGRFWSSPAVGDLDGDGTVEIVVSAWGDSLWVLSNTGQRKWGKLPRAHLSSPALGDVDGDDSLEVVIVSGDVDTVYAWKPSGIGLLGPSGAFARLADGSLFNYGTVALANVDSTAGAEVFYGSFYGNVYAFKGDGSLLWSTDVNGSADQPLSTAAIGNVCGCGSEFELVVAEGLNGIDNNNGLHHLNARNGIINESWTGGSAIPGATSTDGNWIHPPSLADLDGDGDLEIVLATSGVSGRPRQASVVAYDHFEFCTGPRMVGVDSLPQPYLPQILSLSFDNTQPLIANLDQDEKYEVAIGADNFGLYLWEEVYRRCAGDSCGTCLASSCDAERGWPVLYYGEVNGTPWVGDLDEDGFFEMVTRTQDGYVHVFDIPGTYAASDVQWGQFAHDSHHTSLYGYTGGNFQGGGSGGSDMATDVLQNFPNPFNPTTTIGYSLGARARVRLKVYSVTGRVVATLVDAVEEPGQHRIVWDGRGDDGRVLASGIYLYRFEAGDVRQTRKLLMLK